MFAAEIFNQIVIYTHSDINVQKGISDYEIENSSDDSTNLYIHLAKMELPTQISLGLDDNFDNLNQSLMEVSFNDILSLPYEYYRNRTTGEIISRINDLNIVRDVINKFLLTIMIDLILTILSLYFLLRINNILFLISLIIMIIHIIIYFIFKNKTIYST